MLDNWKLKDRTLLGFAIPTILIFVFSVIVYATSSQTRIIYKQVGMSNEAIIGTNNMALSLANMNLAIRRYLYNPKKYQDALERYAFFNQRFQEGLNIASKVAEDKFQEERLKTMQNMFNEFEMLVKDTITTPNFENNRFLIEQYLEKSGDMSYKFRQIHEEFASHQKEIMSNRIEGTKVMLNLMSLLAVLVTILTIAIAFFVTSVVSRSLGSRVSQVVDVAEQISAGDFTLSLPENELKTKDELGQIMASFQIMLQKLSTLIRQVQSSGIQVTTSATLVGAAGTQLETTLTEQVASTNQVTATAKEIAATSKELAHTMEQVVTMSQATTTAANISQTDLQRMETSMRQLATATNTIATRLGIISEKANNINNIVLTITKVADQTNLLSLNAAIEAEKAGEYGLGFAVVAREIRRLADQTAVATLDIEQMVKQMQSSVSTGVMEMDKFAAEVGRSVADVSHISSQVGQIIQQVQDLNPRFAAVNQGMEMQSLGAQQISDAMVQLSSTSIQTADSLREINQALAQLNQVARGLRQEVSVFKVNSNAVVPTLS
ncbi:methyl-accepting chemotaxis protein [Nostoc sp. FACHB-87]|uniref:methyl-accepting chemotaxis protein n=1 Tax=Nostocaceae TaxID=1162 RepID=UPI0016832E01|nr:MULTISPECIES: methyl-accepting chemotaxis protein [Nostocaceae]MBD2457492.1 methyl-accepting chemotaxis protein [Nostoc sp. FACHB-87]MBD2477540.1 methyl-accepting chemotaxis protein [Anabaena sp. FACHB-83]